MENTANSKEIRKLLEEYPLYRKLKVEMNKYELHFWFMHKQTFNFYCKTERAVQTFELRIAPEATLGFYEKLPGDMRPSMKFNYTGPMPDRMQHFKGTCSSCKKYHVDFLIELVQDGEFPQSNANGAQEPTFFLRKVGQFPPFDITPDKEIFNYLSDENGDYYKKALMNISTSYGIGAFAYFRRIIESVIKAMAQDISELDFEEAKDVKSAIIKYERDHQMKNLIDELSKHLPSSLKPLNPNPIQLLYEQLSIGIHGLTDSECLERAVNIDTLLKFVIRKINEEKYELGKVQEAMKALK